MINSIRHRGIRVFGTLDCDFYIALSAILGLDDKRIRDRTSNGERVVTAI